jgi:hypothetical protein
MNDNPIIEDWKNITDPKERLKAYYKAYKKIWRENNKDKLKNYWLKCRNKKNEKQKIYRKENKEKSRAYYEANKNKIRLRRKIYDQANKDKRRQYLKKYFQENKLKVYANINNKLKTDPQYKLSLSLRRRLRCALKSNYKSGSAINDLGCSIEELKNHLESKFQEGMSWDNWSYEGWHIDHIKPLASFDLTDRNQLLQACHYTNLQPLWAKDNRAKSDKTI